MMTRARRARPGFTLWELTMILLVMAIGATLAAPAFARFGQDDKPSGAARHHGRAAARRAQSVDGLQRDRHAAHRSENAQVRGGHIGVNGYGVLAKGTLDLGLSETLVMTSAAAVHLSSHRRRRSPTRWWCTGSDAEGDTSGSMEWGGACRHDLVA